MATQSPWKWHKRKHSNTYFLANENETDDLCMIIDDGSAYGEYGTTIDVDGDDARLIAAAPELLEALQELIEGYENYTECGMFDMLCNGDEIKKAVKAITKALGETK